MRLRRNVKLTSARDPRTGAVQYFAKDAANGEVFYFGEQELFLCQTLDGVQSFEAIQREFEAKFNTRLSDAQLSAFIRELSDAGLLEPATASGSPETTWKSPEEPPAAVGARLNDDEPRVRFRWSLFDPSSFLKVVVGLLWPLKHLVWVLMPATILAGLILVHRQEEFVSDIVAMATSRTIQSVVLLVAMLLVFEFVVRTA